MLVSAVIRLSPIDDAQVSPFLGRAVHALFLRLVEEADPSLAAALHEDEQVKPFTASSLLELPLRGQSPVQVNPSLTYHLRFTSFETRLSGLLLNEILPSLPATVDLDGTLFAVKGAITDSREHPWAGTVEYGTLAQQWLLAPKEAASRIGLSFAAPTTFRSKGHNVPLPLPGLVFGSLVDRWNAYSPTPVAAEARRFAEECLAISRYDLRTHLVNVGGGKQVGFAGNCEYVAMNRDKYWLHVLGLLAAFAFFSGVGYKTTMGMGRVGVIDERGTGRQQISG